MEHRHGATRRPIKNLTGLAGGRKRLSAFCRHRLRRRQSALPVLTSVAVMLFVSGVSALVIDVTVPVVAEDESRGG